MTAEFGVSEVQGPRPGGYGPESCGVGIHHAGGPQRGVYLSDGDGGTAGR